MNLKPLLALTTLAAALDAPAQSTAVTNSSLIASYSLGTGVTFGGYTAYEYDHVGTANLGGSDDDGGRAILSGSAGTSHSHVDGTSLFSMGSTASAAIDSPDYDAITPGADPYIDTYRGYTYVLTFTAGGAGGTVRFDMHGTTSLIGAAASPHGLQQYDADFDYGIGAYASGDAGAGVIDVTGNPEAISTPENHLGDFDSTSHEDTTFIPTPTYQTLDSATLSSTFTLAANETRTYRLYASTHAEVDYYNPVPEPAPCATLALGALALLRRRKSA